MIESLLKKDIELLCAKYFLTLDDQERISLDVDNLKLGFKKTNKSIKSIDKEIECLNLKELKNYFSEFNDKLKVIQEACNKAEGVHFDRSALAD